MEEESNWILAFPDTLSKRKNGSISVLISRKPTHTDQQSYFNSNHKISGKEKCYLFLFNRAYSIITEIITDKEDLNKKKSKK